MQLYKATVINNKDPKKIARVQIRVNGIHNKHEDAHLPWAEVMGSTAFGLVGGVGISSMLHQGTAVWVVFQDEDTATFQKPVIVGTVLGINEGNPDGFNDPDGNFPPQDYTSTSDVESCARDEYLKMQCIRTESGHIIQISDTEGGERIKIFHRTGSYILFDPTGDIYVYGVRDAHYKFEQDLTLEVGRDATVRIGRDLKTLVGNNEQHHVVNDRVTVVDANHTEQVKGNQDQNVKGNKSLIVNGNHSIGVQGKQDITSDGVQSISTSSKQNLTATGQQSIQSASGQELYTTGSQDLISSSQSTNAGTVNVTSGNESHATGSFSVKAGSISFSKGSGSPTSASAPNVDAVQAPEDPELDEEYEDAHGIDSWGYNDDTVRWKTTNSPTMGQGAG